MKKCFLFLTIFVISCTSTKVIDKALPNQASIVVDGKLFTALYQQKSAEYKALCLQAYNLAALRLVQYSNNNGKPQAIITDIDETVLDNSAYAVHQGLVGKEYDPQSWFEWSVKGIADTVPGAPSFLKFAASKGVEIFYITNREERERESTLKNLAHFDLPNADAAHLITRNGTSSKEIRRQQVSLTHEIVMLIGDNLADFSSLFDKKSMGDRDANANLSQKDFGNKFIVIPNPNYGDWEGALFNYNYKLTSSQKDSIIKSVLKSY